MGNTLVAETQVATDSHTDRRALANHAFGPPSLKTRSFRSRRTSYRDGSMDSTCQPTANALPISCRDMRRGPCVPGYVPVFFMRFLGKGFAVFLRATGLPAVALVKCSLTLAAS